jgi:ABC-type oligopeptide transport system ATPase subunit
MFDYEPDERTIKAIMENEPIRHAIDKKAQKARNFCRNMYQRVGGHPTASCSFWEECEAFEMVGNRIICQDNAKELILEYFTTYTESSKQNKIYEQMQKVEEQLEKLNEYLNPNSEHLIVRDWRTGGYKVNYESVRYM